MTNFLRIACIAAVAWVAQQQSNPEWMSRCGINR
jgi:hypothetical protein